MRTSSERVNTLKTGLGFNRTAVIVVTTSCLKKDHEQNEVVKNRQPKQSFDPYSMPYDYNFPFQVWDDVNLYSIQLCQIKLHQIWMCNFSLQGHAFKFKALTLIHFSVFDLRMTFLRVFIVEAKQNLWFWMHERIAWSTIKIKFQIRLAL